MRESGLLGRHDRVGQVPHHRVMQLGDHQETLALHALAVGVQGALGLVARAADELGHSDGPAPDKKRDLQQRVPGRARSVPLDIGDEDHQREDHQAVGGHTREAAGHEDRRTQPRDDSRGEGNVGQHHGGGPRRRAAQQGPGPREAATQRQRQPPDDLGEDRDGGHWPGRRDREQSNQRGQGGVRQVQPPGRPPRRVPRGLHQIRRNSRHRLTTFP